MRNTAAYFKILLLIMIFAFVPAAGAVSSRQGPAPLAKGKERTSAKRQSSFNRKNFYRGLSKRLSKNRADYPHLSDREFANFRAVATTGMGIGRLYRSSSPVNPWGKRNLIADNASKAEGIKTFINLGDTEKRLKGYKGFRDSYCSTQNIIRLNLNWKYRSKDFQEKLARGIRAMAHSNPPFLVHCDAGKDRAGFVCAVLEALMGASAEEITADYLVSFYNYFGIRPHTEEYDFVAGNEIRASLALAFGVRDISKADLSAAAERYMLRIGVPADDIAALRQKLGPDI